MLQVIQQPQFIQNGSILEYRTVVVTFSSTDSLIGRTIRFTPALFFQNYNGETPPNAAFAINYPANVSTVNMNYQGGIIPRNFSAKLRSISNKIFRIEYSYIHTMDAKGWMNDFNVSGTQRVLQASQDAGQELINGGNNIYTGQGQLVVWVGYNVGSNLRMAAASIPYSAAFYNKTIFNGSPIGQYSIFVLSNNVITGNIVDGSTMRFLFGYQNTGLVNGTYYGGVMQMNGTGGSGWAGSVNMQYAKLSGNKQGVEGIANDKITAQQAMQNTSPTNGNGFFEVDASYFQFGGVYRAFFVFQVGAVWQSFISNELTVSQTIVPTYGNVSAGWTTITNGAEQDYGECISGVQSGQSLRLCAIMDAASYNANAQANNIGGTFQSNFNGITVIQTNSPTLGLPTGTSLATTTVTNGNDVGACAEITAPSPGIYWYAFIFNFNASKNGQPYVDNIVKWLQLTVSEATNDLAFILETGSVTLGNEFCDDYRGQFDVIVTAPSPNYTAEYVLHYAGDETDVVDCITSSETEFNDQSELTVSIDPACLPIDREICLSVTAVEVDDAGSDVDDCAQDISVDVEFKAQGISGGLSIVALDYNFVNMPGFTQGVASFDINGQQGTVNLAGLTGSIQFDFPSEDQAAGLIINFLIIFGDCRYEFCYDLSLIVENGNETTGIITRSIISGFNGACEFGSLSGFPCDCDAFIELECEEGVITLTAPNSCEDSGSGGSISDVLEYAINEDLDDFQAYTVPVEIDPETNTFCQLLARRTIEFGGNCPTIEIYEYLDNCCPPIECPEDPCEILTEYDGEANTLTLILECGSVIPDNSGDIIQYSIDGGVTFQPYTAPIDTVGVTSVIYIATVEFNLCPSQEIEGEFIIEGEDSDLCQSEPDLAVTYLNGCHTAERLGDVFFVGSDIIYYSTNFGFNFNVWDEVEPICGPVTLLWKREVEYLNDCDTDTIIRVSTDPCCSLQCGPTGCRYEFTEVEIDELPYVEVEISCNFEMGDTFISFDQIEWFLYDGLPILAEGRYEFWFQTDIIREGCPNVSLRGYINGDGDIEDGSESDDNGFKYLAPLDG